MPSTGPNIGQVAIAILGDIEAYEAGAQIALPSEDLGGGVTISTSVKKVTTPEPAPNLLGAFMEGLGAYTQLEATGSAAIPPFTVKVGNTLNEITISLSKTMPAVAAVAPPTAT